MHFIFIEKFSELGMIFKINTLFIGKAYNEY